MRAHGIIGNVGDWTSRDVAYGLIDYCVVLEMVGFAIAHSYTFAYTEYLPGSVPTPEMICQQQHQQENEAFAEASETGQCADNARSRNASLRRSRDVSSYRPPATLEQPMKFRDALWSSTMPRETIQDIQRLRTGFDSALQEVRRDAGISLPEVAIRSDLELHDEGEDHVEEDEANEDEGDDVGRDDDPDDRPAVSFV